MDSNANAVALQMEIQSRYVLISRKIADLSAALTRGRKLGSMNAVIKADLVDLINLASFHEGFYNDVGKDFNKYVTFDCGSKANAKVTLAMWSEVSESLRRCKIVTLNSGVENV